MRAVLDVNVLISALLAPSGSPARLLSAWRDGQYELVVSPLLLDELRRALAYPKLAKHVPAPEAEQFVAWLKQSALVAPDAETSPPVRSPDPGDDYLVSLSAAHNAILVTGDQHLLGLGVELPIDSPAHFLARLADQD